MSNAVVESEVLKVWDPRIDLKERQYVITKGANKISYIPYKTNSTGSSSFSFNVIPPSRNSFVDRKMYIESSITIDFSATVPAGRKPKAGSLVEASKDAPRSFPLSRALATANATIGTTSVSQQTADVIDCLLRTMKVEDLKDYNDGVPTALDRSQSYECYAGNAGGLNVLGNNAQALLNNGEYARGYFQVQVGACTLANGNAIPAAAPAADYDVKQQVTFKVFEPVMLSPFVFGKLNHSSLIGLQNISLVYNFMPNAELVWSGSRPTDDADANLNVTAKVSFAPAGSSQSDAQLWVGYLQPSALMEIPAKVNYNYYSVERFLTTGIRALYFGESDSVTSNNIQLKVVPSLVIAGVRRTKGNQKYFQPDCYCQIERASVNFNGAVGLLSSCNAQELYKISKKNGLNYNWAQWYGQFAERGTGTLNSNGTIDASTPSGTGGLLVFKPAEDFGLEDSLSASVAGAFNFQININFKCIDPTLKAKADETADWEMFVIVVNEGQVSVDVAGTGAVVTQIGCVTEADVLKAETKPWLDYNKVNGLAGGDWLGSLKNFAKKAIEHAPAVLDVAAKVAPHIRDGLKAVGMGRGSGLEGSSLVGSALLSKRSLKDRLRN